MESQLALPPSDELEPGHDDAYGDLEVVEVKEEEGKVLEDKGHTHTHVSPRGGVKLR